MNWFKNFCLISATFLALAKPADSRLQYLRQKHIYPMTFSQFANEGLNGENVKLVKVQQKGDLVKWITTVDNIPVFGSVVTTHINKQGNVDRIEGYVPETLSKFSPIPALPGTEATDLLRIHWHHKGLTKVYWDDDEPKLYVLHGTDGVTKLVWRASYGVDWQDGVTPEAGYGPVPAYITGLVNAHTGKVEKTWNNLQTAAYIPAIVGNDNIGASLTDIEVIKHNHQCRHVDEDRRVKSYTLGNNRFFHPDITVTDFICDWAKDKNWDLYNFTGGFSPRNEAFQHGVRFVDLWRKLVGDEILPYRTDKSYLEFYVHYGYQTEEASFRDKFFIFGDGNKNYYPMTALDIVCHEIGHGVTAWHGGNMEYLGESGALNEAYSDMLGETCDMFYNNKKNYLLGEDIMKPGKGEAIRDMCKPSRFGGLEHYKDYNASVNVHKSSGIYNKAWCTLSKTKDWDYIKAFQIFTDANLLCWAEETTMHCGACSVENVAVDIGLSKADVTAAFQVVGIDCSLCEMSLKYG
ncbi:elastase-like [Watersipora subatra]|uniref:elastase-like n=1 Tax=Watersipora subatra TaxID=2589382 RepID=UPI00355B5999